MGDRSVAGRAVQEATYYEQDREILRENAAHGCLTKFMYLEKLGKFIGQKVSKAVLFNFSTFIESFC